MKDQVKEMFAEITMPEESVRKIRAAMAEGRRPKRNYIRRMANAAAMLAAALVMLMFLSPEVRAAVNNWVVKYVFPESGLTIYKEIDENGDVLGAVCVDTEAPPFAQVRDSRLYFICNGEEMDITDQISEDAPFYYNYVDEYGLTHYRVVGYIGSIENFGIYEFIRKVEDGQKSWEGWEGGSGRNFLSPETGERYPWVDIVWEELDVPWPMPGE